MLRLSQQGISGYRADASMHLELSPLVPIPFVLLLANEVLWRYISPGENITLAPSAHLEFSPPTFTFYFETILLSFICGAELAIPVRTVISTSLFC